MKPEVQAKFLQHLNRKNKDGGFTLIELLVVIIIIGILAAIALPSFLNQANKGKQAEAKQYVGALNRAQQAYYVENSSFVTDLAVLGVGIKTDTTNYTYTAENLTGTAVGNYGTTKVASLKSYVGSTYLTLPDTTTSEVTTISAIFESTAPNDTTKPAPVDQAGTTPTGYVVVK